MAKFVLIDHSITGVGGHYYEYAQHVLEAAKEANYEPILVTNRRFKADASVPWRTHAIYECGFWANMARPRWLSFFASVKKQFRHSYLRWRTRLIYSELGVLWSTRRQPGHYFRMPGATRRSSWQVASLFAVAAVVKLVIALTDAVREAVPFLGRLSVAGGHFVSVFSRPFANAFRDGGWAWRWLGSNYKFTKFQKATLKLSRIEELAAGDVVLLPTMSEVELAAVAAALRECEALQHAKWHMIFRRNIFPGRSRVQTCDSPELGRIQCVFQQCADLHARGLLHFHTDTAELTDQYVSVTGQKFHTLPIPHTRESIPVASCLGDGKVRPVRLAYLGDARTEKGYHHLPRMVGDLWREYVKTGKAVFSLQSNYNTASGEPPAIVARSLLRAYRSEHVALLETPLASEEYWRLLLNSDINLLPYDADNYFARSSGILAESLAAGVPVVVPAGTWLSRQFIDEAYAYRRSLCEKHGALSSILATSLQPRHGGVRERTTNEGRDWTIGSGERWTECRFEGPNEASHILVSASLARMSTNDLLDLCVQQFHDRKLVDKRFSSFELGASERYAAAVLPVAGGASRFRLRLRNAAAERSVVISDLRIDFLRLPGGASAVPTSSVGQVYRSIEEITGAVREMIEHHQHYQATARNFSRQWLAFHNAANVVQCLEKAAATSASQSPAADVRFFEKLDEADEAGSHTVEYAAETNATLRKAA